MSELPQYDPKAIADRCNQYWADRSVDDGFPYTSPVGSYPIGKSWVNAYDMAGNVWQWVHDWYRSSYSNSVQTDPFGPDNGDFHTIRGGSYYNTLSEARAASRLMAVPTDRLGAVGFRIVVGLPPATK